MATHVSHISLPFPVRGARYTVALPFMDADGDPTDPTATIDTEISVDGGAFADAAEELSVIGSGGGWGMVTLTGAEMNNSLIVGQTKNGAAKAPQFAVVPRTLPVLVSGTAQAGAAGTITLPSGAAALDDVYNGCIIKTTGGTGGGGTGGANNQARVVKDYVGSTRVATVEPNWETTPDNTTTIDVLGTDLVASTSSSVASSVLDEPTASHTTAGTVGKAIVDINTNVTDMIARIVALAIATGAVTTDGSNSATSFETNLVQTTNDFWKDAYLVLTSGALAGQVKRITAYNGTSKFITVAGGYTGTPADGVTFAIVNR